MPVLLKGSVILIWGENERPMIKTLHMDNLIDLLSITRMDRVPNAGIRELCGVSKGVDERIDETIFLWFHHIKRMENDRIAKRVYVGDYVGNGLVGRTRKRWTDSVNGCSKKRVLNFGQARRIVNDRNE